MTPDAQQPEYIITEANLQIILDWLSYRRYNDCDVDTIVEMIRTRPHTPTPTDEQCRICSEAIRNKTMDEFGILHGKDAKRFHDYINNPPEETPKSKAMIKQAYEISKTISLDPDHDAAIASAATLAAYDKVIAIASSKPIGCVFPDKICEHEDCTVCIAKSLRQEAQQC